jgi:hypothetical protein
MSLTRAAAASVSRITWGLGRTAMSFSSIHFSFGAGGRHRTSEFL